MELPHLGKHCDEKSCHQLDFLPMKCDACQLVFCRDHVRYELHSCQSAYKKNVQVPVCPLCSQPVPWKRGEAPDIAVGDHIDRDCQSDPARQKRKVLSNRCTVKGCKQKEIVPVICDQCKLNHCLKHRHPLDHSCKGNNPAERARQAALARSAASSAKNFPATSRSSAPSRTTGNTSSSSSSSSRARFSVAAVQGTMSEDEALALALQASLQHQTTTEQQEEADRLLALSLQNGELTPQPPTAAAAGGSTSSNNNCTLS